MSPEHPCSRRQSRLFVVLTGLVPFKPQGLGLIISNESTNMSTNTVSIYTPPPQLCSPLKLRLLIFICHQYITLETIQVLNEYNILEWCGYYNTARYFDLMLHNPAVIDELCKNPDNCIHAAEYWVWIECYLAYLRHWAMIICICGTYTCVTAPTYFHTSFKPFSV